MADNVINLDSNVKVDFSSNIYRVFSGRIITQYAKDSNESKIIRELSNRVRSIFNVRFPDRHNIINELFDFLRVCVSLSDFTIVRFDFKKFFYSVSTAFVYNEYIKNSSLKRWEKDIISDLCLEVKKCIPGISIFNYFIEIVSREFDHEIHSTLGKEGLIFYRRYVDDGILIFNCSILETQIEDKLKNIIEKIFHNKGTLNKVRIQKEKFVVINRGDLIKENKRFDFLGYEFFFSKNAKKINEISIQIGISEKKRRKYQNKVNEFVSEIYSIDHNIVSTRLRHAIKAHCSRVVYFVISPTKGHKMWVSKGIIANYNKLSDYYDCIHQDTKKFLSEIYYNAFGEIGVRPPHYLKEDRYSLCQGFIKNRALIFHEMIGVNKKCLCKYLTQIGEEVDEKRDFDYLLKDYLINIKIGY